MDDVQNNCFAKLPKPIFYLILSFLEEGEVKKRNDEKISVTFRPCFEKLALVCKYTKEQVRIYQARKLCPQEIEGETKTFYQGRDYSGAYAHIKERGENIRNRKEDLGLIQKPYQERIDKVCCNGYGMPLFFVIAVIAIAIIVLMSTGIIPV